ncbi:hypothetical protein AB4Z40_08665 [Bosea sp. 2YAB26]|uniref:hypothetical protein n=1 Tax=Bosea sp. 2YAB26 TaxID=3237478 RepID=UPI003F8DA45C
MGRFIPDPGSAIFLVLAGLVFWGLFKMVTYRSPVPGDDEGVDAPRLTLEDEARRRSF